MIFNGFYNFQNEIDAWETTVRGMFNHKNLTVTHKSHGLFISFSEKSPELIKLLFLNELHGSRGTETMNLKAIWTKYTTWY